MNAPSYLSSAWPVKTNEMKSRSTILIAAITSAAFAQSDRAPDFLGGKTLEANYNGGAALIIEHRCLHCHRPGAMAPMSFVTFQEFRKWSRDTYTPMTALIRERAMPPWIADPAIGAFNNREFITQPEMDLLIEWLGAGLPRGAGEYTPTITWDSEWDIGQPDHIFELPEYTLAEDPQGEFKTFAVQTSFPEDRWIVAFEIRPEEPAIVTAIDAGPLGAFQLGNPSTHYRNGTARLLKAGAAIEVHVHYRKDEGYAPTDRTRIGVKFAGPSIAPQEIHLAKTEAAPFTIPAGEAGFTQSVTFTMPGDGQVEALMPVLHERGVSVQYKATFPGGREQPLLSIPAWDARWKYRYAFAQPVPAPKGTQITLEAHYDNSADNLKNPDPWSDATPGPTGETLQAWIGYTLD